jgi:hypothetical protein
VPPLIQLARALPLTKAEKLLTSLAGRVKLNPIGRIILFHFKLRISTGSIE